MNDSSKEYRHHAGYLNPGRLPVLKVLAVITLLLPLLLPSVVRGDFDSSPNDRQAQPKQAKSKDTQAKGNKTSAASQKKGSKQSAQPKKSKKSGSKKAPKKTR
jgi:hypothetical protein